VRTRAHQRGDAQMQRCLAAGGGNRANAAFKSRHPLLQHRVGRVADARVDVTGTLQVEQRGRVVARFKDKRGGQVNRHGACACGRVGRSACVQGQRVKARVRVARHDAPLWMEKNWKKRCKRPDTNRID